MTVPAFKVVDPAESGWRFIAAAHPELYWSGRIDRTNPQAPVLIWPGSALRARFFGQRLGLRFSEANGQNFYNVIIDDRIYLLKLETGSTRDYLLTEKLTPGVHELSLFKRTEALAGQAAFNGLLLEADACLAGKPAPLPLYFEFYGDSITAGACNEDPGVDQYDDLATHNNYLAYGALTARALQAEYSCIAVSGTGICCSWNPVLLRQVFDKVSLAPDAARYDFTGRQPDLVVINLGQNDYGYPQAEGRPFPADFAPQYREFVQQIRTLYPQAQLICALGGMTAYRESPELRVAFDRAVTELTTNDPKIHRWIFTACSVAHPRVATHLKLAEELTEFIKGEILPKIHQES